MDVSHILDSLNDPQRQAVTSESRNLLVLAGAGSGKTRVLVHRIAWMIQLEGVSPQGILAVTFTNKAANEMRARIEELLMRPSAGMWVGTFHGLAHRLLRAHWREAGLPEKFQILDADDQLRLIKRLHRELGIDESRWPAKQCQWFISAQKDEGLRPDAIEDQGDEYNRIMVQVYRAYEEACQRGGMIDFGEILLRCHEMWLNNPELLQHYRQRFAHILVDEFQDTNTVQYAWLRVLAGDSGRVMVVGDDDQSIYGWRGARIENIQDFSHHFDDVEVVRLEQNYRSTSTILEAANRLIEHNSGRLGKELWTDGNEGEPISLYTAFNEQDEARFICEQVAHWVSQGGLRSEAVILYRSNAQSRELEEALLRVGMPYRIYGGFRFYERLEIRNALAYMKLALHRDDDAAMERVINTPVRGIGNKTLETLRQVARMNGLTLWSAALKALSENLLPARALQNVKAFLELIEGLSAEINQDDLQSFTDLAIKRSGLIGHHEKEGGEKARSRLDNLEELINAARAFDPAEDPVLGEGLSNAPDTAEMLGAFLDKAALDAGDTQAQDHEDAVQLMTMHAAKGLEFPLVFIAGMEEGLFPHRMSADSLEGLEEERRLCYVAITRACRKLYLCHAESRRLHGEENLSRPSRFIREIPDHLVQEVRLKGSIHRGWHAGHGTQAQRVSGSSEEGEGESLALGQRVRHPKFGEGVVLHYEGRGKNARVQINFDEVGGKWLVMSYARLEVIGAR